VGAFVVASSSGRSRNSTYRTALSAKDVHSAADGPYSRHPMTAIANVAPITRARYKVVNDCMDRFRRKNETDELRRAAATLGSK
jgi:hypothetical protein